MYRKICTSSTQDSMALKNNTNTVVTPVAYILSLAQYRE